MSAYVAKTCLDMLSNNTVVSPLPQAMGPLGLIQNPNLRVPLLKLLPPLNLGKLQWLRATLIGTRVSLPKSSCMFLPLNSARPANLRNRHDTPKGLITSFPSDPGFYLKGLTGYPRAPSSSPKGLTCPIPWVPAFRPRWPRQLKETAYHLGIWGLGGGHNTVNICFL